MILIISNSTDYHTDLVVDVLLRRQVPYVRLDTDRLPQSYLQSTDFSGTDFGLLLEVNGQSIDLKDVEVVWHRRQPPATLSEQIEPADREFALKEWKHFLAGTWHLLRDKFWINPLQAAEAAEIKPYQLRIAQSIGFEVPRTLMTNDPEEAIRFFDECSGQVVYKAFSQLIRDGQNGGAEGVYTTRVQRSHLLSRKDQIRLAPCIFQEYVPKEVELRVIVVGNQIFTEEINTQKSTRASDDWRRYDLKNTAWGVYHLPSSLQKMIHNAMRQFGLVFGCVDLVLTPDGRYVFLEINPMGQWMWVESLTGLPLLAHFTEMLIQGSPDYETPKSPVSIYAATSREV